MTDTVRRRIAATLSTLPLLGLMHGAARSDFLLLVPAKSPHRTLADLLKAEAQRWAAVVKATGFKGD